MARPELQNGQKPKKEEPKVGGYECEFVQPPPGYFQTECSVCLLVLRSPHITSCCGKYFCKECIDRVQESGKGCPKCEEEGFAVMYNRTHDVSLKQLEVYCTHRKVGCEWKGKLEMLDNHLNVDPEREKQLEGCAFVEVQCYHDGCGQSFQRQLIAKHQSEECPQQPFSCEHCHEYESTYHDVTTNHWPVCKCYPVSCPHNCTENTFERQILEQHLNKVCPLQEVECDFKYAGCETKLPRKDMPEHVSNLKQMSHHMSMLGQQNRTLARQNQELLAKLLEKGEQIGWMPELKAIENLAGDRQGQSEVAEQVNEEQLERLAEELRLRIAEVEEKNAKSASSLEARIMTLEKTEADIENLEGRIAEIEKKAAEPAPGSRIHVASFARGHSLAGDVGQLEGRVAELEKKGAVSASSLESRIHALEGGKASMAEVEKLEARVAELEKSADATVVGTVGGPLGAPKGSAFTKDKGESKAKLEDGRAPETSAFTKAEHKSMIDLGDRTKAEHETEAEQEVRIAPIKITMTDYGRHKRENDRWFSRPFYTHPRGYKLCLAVDANGCGDGEGTHVSCFIYLLAGEFDNHLKWPFRGDIPIQLLNQRKDDKHHTETVNMDNETPAQQTKRVTSGEMAQEGWGFQDFIPHRQLGYNPVTSCQYLKNDSLCFQVKAKLP